MENTFLEQVTKGDRFQFGSNWKSFLDSINEQRINNAAESLDAMLGKKNYTGLSFLDVGSGSGLFSLAARKLGFKVYSFDFDKQSIACTKKLKELYFKEDNNWTIEEGSVLDLEYIRNLGTFDVVYSWGVLHHTGQMWKALDNADLPVKENGKLFIAIYNDQHLKSKIWLTVKQIYNANMIGRLLVKSFFISFFTLGYFIRDITRLKNPLSRYREYKQQRGMALYTDLIDWIGGLPFEVASPDAIFNFYTEKNYILQKLITTNHYGCNQFVFKKNFQSSKQTLQ